jgi:hypothetical protein
MFASAKYLPFWDDRGDVANRPSPLKNSLTSGCQCAGGLCGRGLHPGHLRCRVDPSRPLVVLTSQMRGPVTRLVSLVQDPPCACAGLSSWPSSSPFGSRARLSGPRGCSGSRVAALPSSWTLPAPHHGAEGSSTRHLSTPVSETNSSWLRHRSSPRRFAAEVADRHLEESHAPYDALRARPDRADLLIRWHAPPHARPGRDAGPRRPATAIPAAGTAEETATVLNRQPRAARALATAP